MADPVRARLRPRTPDVLSTSGHGISFLLPDLVNFDAGAINRYLHFRYVIHARHINLDLATFDIKIHLNTGTGYFDIDIDGAWYLGGVDSTTINFPIGGKDFLGMFIKQSQTSVASSLTTAKIILGISFSNGDDDRLDTFFENTVSDAGIWNTDFAADLSQECKVVSDDSNCTLTHDFGFILVSRAQTMGFYPRALIPS